MKLTDIGEFGLIDQIKKLVHQPTTELLVGIDDDAAAIKISDQKILLLSTDAFTEGIHFDLSYFSFYQLGWRVMAANLSDIAAMGGWPKYALVSLGLPTQLSVDSVLEFYRGMKTLSDEFQTQIVGGDTSRSPDRVFISVSIVGEVAPDKLTRRSGAQIGDAIFVTGNLGGSEAGLKVLKTADARLKEKFLGAVQKHLSPRPRVREAQFLVEHFPIHAMIDISDGLASEINHICRLSDVGAKIFEKLVPIATLTKRAAEHFNEQALEYALYGGEDFELLFAAPAEIKKELPKKFFEKFGISCSQIGLIQDASEAIKWEHSDGSLSQFTRNGYDHFK
jgi:thiamine-monophosphate kinase